MILKINRTTCESFVDEIEIDDVKDCFLLSRNDTGGMNRSVTTYFAQFRRNGNIYTIEFKFQGFLIDLNFKIGDIHSMGYNFSVKKFIEKHKGSFEKITEDAFFAAYKEVSDLSMFKTRIDYGTVDRPISIVPV